MFCLITSSKLAIEVYNSSIRHPITNGRYTILDIDGSSKGYQCICDIFQMEDDRDQDYNNELFCMAYDHSIVISKQYFLLHAAAVESLPSPAYEQINLVLGKIRQQVRFM